MFLQLDKHSGVPVYRQIVDQIRFQAASGRLPAGSELPSTRALSAELGLNPMTVSKAYSLLEQEGVAERRPGLSLIVRAQAPANQSEAREEQLLVALRTAALRAGQLGVERGRALELFADVLDRKENP